MGRPATGNPLPPSNPPETGVARPGPMPLREKIHSTKIFTLAARPAASITVSVE